MIGIGTNLLILQTIVDYVKALLEIDLRNLHI